MEDIQITINGTVLEYYYNNIIPKLENNVALQMLKDIEDTLQYELDNIKMLKGQIKNSKD